MTLIPAISTNWRRSSERFRWVSLVVFLACPQMEFKVAVAEETTSGEVGLHLPDHFIEISNRIFSGAQPEQDDQLASLSAMGIRTIVSVDGAIPDVETASRFGLRYVHIPIGYDGIPSQASRDLAAVAGRLEGSFFVHCHHGRHRGPAAATVVAMAAGQIDNAAANQVLKQAGTGQQYAGLWRDVARYKPPVITPSATGLVEKTETSLLVRSMSQLDRSFESFNKHHDHASKVEGDSHEKTLVELACLIEEGFNESMRAPEITSNPEMASLMRKAQNLSNELRKSVDHHSESNVDRLLERLKQSCINCHQTYRN